MDILFIDGDTLTLDDVMRVAEGAVHVTLHERALPRMRASRALVEEWVRDGKVMYGVTTGFGEFANVSIDAGDLAQLQRNLIMSHAVGCGDPIPKPITRILMLLRANALAKGYSGIRIETVGHLLAMLNADIVPVIPSQGSVGSSGDLVQLAHLVLGMMGEGLCWGSGTTSAEPAADRLRRAGLQAVTLGAKEGLALINGTQMMAAYLAWTVMRAASLAKQFDVSGTMSFEALRGTDRAFAPQVHAVRPHDGQQRVARNILRLIDGSEIRESHREDHGVVQDAYSMRCMPQVHGASRDALAYARGVLITEINSATDNPLIFPETGDLIEGGNFHGQPLALAADFAAIAIAELANIAERRIERLVNGKLSGLPRFLTERGGLHSGMMIAQYTAASLVSENKSIAHPASVDSIPTSANQEDHNSMGSIAARKAAQILGNAVRVAAIEYMTSAQALDFHAPLKPGRGTRAVHAALRDVIPHLDADRILHHDLVAITDIVRDDSLLRTAEHAVGPLE